MRFRPKQNRMANAKSKQHKSPGLGVKTSGGLEFFFQKKKTLGSLKKYCLFHLNLVVG
jgi:hypothetical protein